VKITSTLTPQAQKNRHSSGQSGKHFKIENVVVTGATGFIGRNVVKNLLKMNYKVFSLARNLNKAQSLSELKGSTLVQYDFLDGKVPSTLPNNATLIHCAWDYADDWYSLMHIEEGLPAHYAALKNFISYGIRDLLICGTRCEYGIQYGPVSATNQTQPVTPYAIAKDTLHKSLRALQTVEKFNLIWVRLFYPYGEGQSEKSVIGLFDRAIKDKKTEFNMSHGEQIYDFLPIEDASLKIIALLTHLDGVFNVCSGKPISLRRFLEQRAQDARKTIKLNTGFYEYKKLDSIAIWGGE
jgi:nucleoside-diphosphate-sugar epimerase